MIDRLTIQAQRDELQTRIDRARLVFADYENVRDQALRGLAELTRHLDGMAGGLVVYDALLQIEDSAPAVFDPLMQTMYEEPSLYHPPNLERASLSIPCENAPPDPPPDAPP